MCGEGGEYESCVFDCPIFAKRLAVLESEVVELGNEYSPQAHLVFRKVGLVDKTAEELEADATLMKQLTEQV